MSNMLAPIELTGKQKRWLRKKKKGSRKTFAIIVQELIQKEMDQEKESEH